MKMGSQTSRSSIIKKAKASSFNKPDRRQVDAPPAVPIPAYIFNLGRALSHTEMLLVQKMTRDGCLKEELMPTADDFEKFSKLLQKTSYSHKDPTTERVTTTHINIQAVTALKDDFILSDTERAMVRKVVGWLALLCTQ